MGPLKPRAIAPGAKIGVVSPSSPVDQADLERGLECFKARGYSVEVSPYALDSLNYCDYLAGADEDRAQDLNSFFARKDIDAIICSRGGYGATRLLPHLDWDMIRSNPKSFVGYSDITTLHCGIASRAGFVSFHGPMTAAHASLSVEAQSQFWSMLENVDPQGSLQTGNAAISTVVGGIAEGRITGGCLSLLAQICGSRYAPDFTDKIVLIEDVGETVYRADRNLWQLLHSGAFDNVAGFVIGNLTNWQKLEAEPPNNYPERLYEEFFGALAKPTVSGYPFGHEPNPLTIPLGVVACLNANEGTLTLLEGAVSN